MIVDWTITLGTIIEMAGVGAGGLLFLMRFSSTVKLFSYRVENIEKTTEEHGRSLSSLTTAMVSIAIQDERINNLSKRIDNLSHGAH